MICIAVASRSLSHEPEPHCARGAQKNCPCPKQCNLNVVLIIQKERRVVLATGVKWESLDWKNLIFQLSKNNVVKKRTSVDKAVGKWSVGSHAAWERR